MVRDNHLEHHGVKGMKWGHRKDTRSSSKTYSFKVKPRFGNSRLLSTTRVNYLSGKSEKMADYKVVSSKGVDRYGKGGRAEIHDIMGFGPTGSIARKNAIKDGQREALRYVKSGKILAVKHTLL